MSPYVAREVGLVETKSMARRVEVRMGGFHLSDGHRNCCSFHCSVSRFHFSARKSAESDGIISLLDGATGLRHHCHVGDGSAALKMKKKLGEKN